MAWKYEGVRQDGTDWEFTDGNPRKLYVVSLWDGRWSGIIQTSKTDESESEGDAPMTAEMVQELRALIPAADLPAEQVSEPRTFEILAEAACCMWEAMCEWRNPNAATGTYSPVREAFEQRGTVTMRHLAISLADLCCATFDAIGHDRVEELDLIPYDWEFCPAFLRALPVGVWSGHAAPDAETMARATIANAEKTIPIPAIMVAAGFEAVATGGGCKAWQKSLPGKGHVWITDADGTGLGVFENETYLVGLYRAGSCDELSQTGSCDGIAAAIAEANRLLSAFYSFA